jgi:hypothetical protein
MLKRLLLLAILMLPFATPVITRAELPIPGCNPCPDDPPETLNVR